MNLFLKLILRVSLLVVGLIAVLHYLTKNEYGTTEINQTNLNWFTRDTNSVDYLFIGNSYCYSGVNNVLFDSITEKKSFNLGYATAGPVIVESMLEKVKLERIEEIIWVTSPADIINITDNSDAYPYYLFNKVDEIDYYLRGYYELADLLSINQKRIHYYFADRERHTFNKRGLKGEFTSYENKYSSDSSWFSNVVGVENVNKSKVKLLLKVVAANPNIILVVYPYEKFANSFNPIVLATYKTVLDKLGKSGVRIIDANSTADLLTREDWRNFDHVNSRGARKLTKLIADSIFTVGRRSR